MSEPLHDSSITGLSGRIRDRAVSPIDVVESCLERIDRLNPSLNAFITVLREAAMTAARHAAAEIAAGTWRGPLHGIPVAVKDFYDTAGVRTTAAFAQFAARVPKADAAVVARLKHAGAIIVGKTNMHTLGMGTTGLDSHFGPVRNPWHADVIPGGSSSGSAAAVAAGLCFATVDTDAIGSCRLPAACCGVVGFKGTYGTIDLTGILAGEPSPDDTIRWLAHAGITTRLADDTACVLDVLAAPQQNGSASAVRVGVARNVRAGREVSDAFEHAVDAIRRLGHDVTDATAPLHDVRSGVANIETDRAAIAGRAFTDIDLLVLPTTADVPPTVQAAAANPLMLSPENTAFANYYGLPAISVPCGFDGRGVPLGVQIVGPPGQDRSVLRLAAQYQTHSNVRSLKSEV